jgi:hypothetical protein
MCGDKRRARAGATGKSELGRSHLLRVPVLISSASDSAINAKSAAYERRGWLIGNKDEAFQALPLYCQDQSRYCRPTGFVAHQRYP